MSNSACSMTKTIFFNTMYLSKSKFLPLTQFNKIMLRPFRISGIMYDLKNLETKRFLKNIYQDLVCNLLVYTGMERNGEIRLIYVN